MPGTVLTQRKTYLNSDVYLAVGIIGVLAVMLIPLPSLALDFLITVNLMISILVLFVVLYTVQPLDFSTFPSVLLITTLFRLSLNIASTRLILINGNRGDDAAGYIIKAFGNSMIGGNYIIGIIVFLILILINFFVITKGAGRIAEVTARFALDAMPGKQMAIDADLNAGIIDDKSAQHRRKTVQQEADFYGSMDGASKFVRGDAIAGILITMINIIGGLIIGVVVHGMSVVNAIQNYTILTIGDGLVSQIPALVISTAAGITVSKAGRENKLGTDFGLQMLGNVKALALVGVASFMFLTMTGIPKFPFIIMGGMFLTMSWRNHMAKERSKQDELIKNAESANQEKKDEDVATLLPIKPLSMELGYGLIPFVDPDQDGELLERIKAIRRQLALELGFIVPSVLIKDNLQLQAGGYSILIKGIEEAKGEMKLGHYLSMQADETEMSLIGEATTEPAFGLPASWISEKQKELAEMNGCTVVDIPTVITTHLTEVIKQRAYEFLTRNDLQKILDQVSLTDPKLVEELVPTILNLGQVQRVLQHLLKEQVSIRDMATILETLSEYAVHSKDAEFLSECCRQALAKTISRQYSNEDSVIPVLTLHPELEQLISSSIQDTPQGSIMSINPDQADALLNAINENIPLFKQHNYQPIILSHPKNRLHLKKLCNRTMPSLIVLSHGEISGDVNIQNLAVVEI